MNLRILLVDDEMIERKAMRKIIEDHFGKEIVCGEAANGRQAIRLAGEKRPDLMLMDVKMPGIDGLEAIEMIRNNHPEIKFIMVSAYDSFEYAKRAMKQGVKEYILKPATKKETVEAILRVYQEIVEEKNKMERERQSKIIAERHFFDKLVEYAYGEELERIQRELFPNMMSAFFMVAEFENKEEIPLIAKTIGDWTKGSYIEGEKNGQTIFFIGRETEVNKAEILTFARKLFRSGESRKWIGIGMPYRSLQEFPKSYKEALIAIGQIKENSRGGYGFLNMQSTSSENDEEEMIEAIFQNDSAKAIELFREIYQKEGKREKLQDLYFSIRNRMRQKGIELGEIRLKNVVSLSDWQDFIQLCSLQVKQFFKSQGHVERAKTYIQKRYHEPIGLEEVAEYVELSPQYFTKLFKEETGKTFIDYVTELRMMKAKELLLKNDLTFKEISFQVGYRDPNYFSRVFKKYFHLSPREFQNQILKK